MNFQQSRRVVKKILEQNSLHKIKKFSKFKVLFATPTKLTFCSIRIPYFESDLQSHEVASWNMLAKVNSSGFPLQDIYGYRSFTFRKCSHPHFELLWHLREESKNGFFPRYKQLL